ncbi:PREDICTED: rust resistance kinase Lr10 [Prunus dulcis]|uniref:PREDICTED: rust resistance kinase Lr10 n=1 Tax=Prunus dulcis TaxID=3755 RepID=A0A5E4ERE6_PRUDU|nr:PREDICTED: rust resistance kinase Lr10 [Prunus dulcis]
MTRKDLFIASVILSSVVIYQSINEVEARILEQVCPSSSCGDIQNISFPFHLKGDPVGCGYPAYELSCVNNKIILEYDPGTYYVKNISYNEHSVDDLTDDFPYRPLGHLSYISFANCSTNISNLASIEFPCFRRNGTHQEKSCSLISIAPADSVDVKFPSYEDVMKVLQAGFNLGWEYYVWFVYVSFDLFWNIPLALILIIRHICAPLAIFVFLIHKYCTTRKIVDNREIVVLHNEQSLMPTRYSYTDVVAMTNNFEDKLGPQGGLGSVYKGQLPDGCLIVVKMLENSRFQSFKWEKLHKFALLSLEGSSIYTREVMCAFFI